MRKTATCLLCFIILSFGCRKENVIPRDTPACIRDAIIANYENKDWPIERVEEYSFQGQLVYIFVSIYAQMPDQAFGVSDANCNTLCTLGGIAGIVNCMGVNFGQNSTPTRTIWKRD